MSRDVEPFAFFATCAAALYLVAIVIFSPGIVHAAEPTPVTRQSPDFAPGMAPGLHPSMAPSDLRATLDDNDEVATLDAISVALSQVGDGGSYVWQRLHGRLSGVFQPTQSFKDRGGNVCRHLIIMLVSGRHTQRTEGIACRLESGRWQLDG
jgi:surface antigen